MARLPQITTVLAVVAFSSSSIVKSPETQENNFELLILHNNDMHARFEQTSQLSGACTVADREAGKCYGGFPRVAYVVKEARRAAAAGEGPPVLYLNAGDTYTGTAWFTIYKWKIAAEFLNALQPDAVSLGNHEFDEDVDGLIPFIRSLTFPTVTANLILNKVPELKKEPNLQNSIILNTNGVKIGIIGYLTPDTKILAPKNDVEYEDEITAIKREVQKLKFKGVKILIALGHSGYYKDLDIAENVEDLDLVIGGHSNTFLSNENNTNEIPEYRQGPYPTVVEQKSGRKVLVVQAYAYTKYLGKLFLTFNNEGEVINYSGEPLLLDAKVPEDPEVLHLVDSYRNDVDEIYNEIVGSSSVLLDGDSCRLTECNLGNFINDAIINYTKKNYNKHLDINISIIQGGRIRSSISHPGYPFNITKGDMITVMPFSDSLCIITMNGTILKKALEHSIAHWRKIDTPGQFLQYSGIEVVYDLSQSPGSRIVTAKGMCITCSELNDITDDLQYKIITSVFIADGGDGYTIFQNLPREVLPYNEVTCTIDYLRRYSPIKPFVSKRIVILNEDKIQNFVLSKAHSINISSMSLFIVCIFMIL